MEQHEQEKAFCKAVGVNISAIGLFKNDHGEPVFQSILELFSKHTEWLIEQGKKGKLTLQECKDKTLIGTKYVSWIELLRDFEISPAVLDAYINKAAEMYANQFIPVAPAENINVEIWKDIKGYKGVYQISSYFRVRSVDRTVYSKRGNGFDMEMSGRIIKPTYGKNIDHLKVNLSKEGKTETVPVYSIYNSHFKSTTSTKQP